MSSLPQQLGLEVVEGPWRIGSEMRWRVQHPQGPAVLGQLLPELAHDASLRRRYVRDVERLCSLGDAGVARVRATGPQPDPRDPGAPPPWRLRDDPPGETLEAWLARRAPAPVDEVSALVAMVAARVQQLNATGAVLRDLNPRVIVLADTDAWLTDVGLARVDVLSTRTAASLVLEGSPYTAPELLARTIVDQRADVYGLGVVLFRALTGQLPHGDASSLLRPPGPPPRVRTLRPDTPAGLDELVARCLAEDPAARPGSAAELADMLLGRLALPDQGPRVPCQACGTALRPGQRLCTHCGKLAVQFTPAREGEPSFGVELTKIDEKVESRRQLEDILGAVGQGPLPALNFLVGDARMYSKEERKRLTTLPAKLVAGLSKSSAASLSQRLRAAGLQSRIRQQPKRGRDTLGTAEKRKLFGIGSLGTVLAVGVAVAGGGSMGALFAAGLLAVITLGVVFGIAHHHRTRNAVKPALVPLRTAAAALPASDPLVARLSALLRDDPPADLREQVGELAVAVQRLVDHRARHAAEAQEIDVVTAPVSELVRLVEAQVQAIVRIDGELAGLNEGALVRALAAADARNEPEATRQRHLDGLDRLRTLEESRARRFHRLLEATRLARRSVELGLAVRDGQLDHDAEVALALATLQQELGHEALPPQPDDAVAALPPAADPSPGSAPG
ncbi:MAG: protein kinase [Deltaproteobacteria bacterium]|nr:protein kinase [Deltaproteobacteria bacterium]